MHVELTDRVWSETIAAVSRVPAGGDIVAPALSAFASALIGDPRVVRVGVGEIAGVSERVDAYHEHALDRYAEIVVSLAGQLAVDHPASIRVLSIALLERNRPISPRLSC